MKRTSNYTLIDILDLLKYSFITEKSTIDTYKYSFITNIELTKTYLKFLFKIFFNLQIVKINSTKILITAKKKFIIKNKQQKIYKKIYITLNKKLSIK